MARAKAHASMQVAMDLREVEAALNEVGAFTDAVGKISYGVARHVFNTLKWEFMKSTHTAAQMSAATDPAGKGSFHHLYEPYEIGNPREALFDLIIPQAVRESPERANVFARIDWKRSTEIEDSMGVIATGNPYGRYPSRTVPFWNKAQVLEEGHPVTVPEGTTWVVSGYERMLKSGQRVRREGLQLVTAQGSYQQETKSEETYHSLLNHFNGFLRGGLADTAVMSALNQIDKHVIEDTLRELEKELKRFKAKYASGHSDAARSRTQIFRGQMYGFSPKSGRGNINKKYITYLENRIDKLRRFIDDDFS